jgi:very-short-patch-repair endonuclease
MRDKSTQSPEPTFNSSPELWEQLKPLAREKRHEPTPAEDFLWQHIRGRQVASAKFRRQHTIGRFIVDFFCVQAKLVIEVDGEIHQYTQEEDAIRQEFIEAHGFTVLRFTNDEVLKHIGTVIQTISTYLKQTKANKQTD